LLGGEALPASLLKEMQPFNKSRIYNMYGPTETTIWSTMCDLSREAGKEKDLVSIGEPFGGNEVYVLDGRGQLVPVGVTGELYIGGKQVTRGYLNQPGLTSDRFIPNPYGGAEGDRLYRTGDLVRWRHDGKLEFLQRIDQQVKIRGFRIELGEIEVCLSEHPAVRDVVVTAWESEPGEKQIVAYYTLADVHQRNLQSDELQRFVGKRLPQYMIPSVFVPLVELPLNANGKVDRKALPKPGLVGRMEHRYVAPVTRTETILSQIWSEVLGIPQVGVRDNFFQFGGHSLRALGVVSRANQAGLKLNPHDIFENPTIEKLATLVEFADVVQAEQGIITTGDTALLPSVHRFITNWPEELPENISLFWFDCRDRISPALLREAIFQLVIQHDALRLKLTRFNSEWQQSIVGIDEINRDGIMLDIDLRNVPSSERESEVAHSQRALITSIDLACPPLIRSVLYDYGVERPQKLLVAMHHCAFDPVSIEILREDLESAYQQLARGEEVRLHAKTTSLKTWSEELVRYGRSEAAQKEAAYWSEQLRRNPGRLPIQPPAAGSQKASHPSPIITPLTEDQTRVLLQTAIPSFKASLDEILLAGLANALQSQIGPGAFHVELMHHGRNHSFTNVDISRTVGWFSAEIPFLLDVTNAQSPNESVETVKEQLRGVPNHGIGYGVLRYMVRDRALQGLPYPRIRFNNQGNFSQGSGEDTLFQLAHGETTFKPTRKLWTDTLYISVTLSQQRLTLSWHFEPTEYDEDAVFALAEKTIENIRALLNSAASVA